MARPTSIAGKFAPSAAMSEPTVMTAKDTSSILRLPYMSAMRETIGVATAPVSRVAVTSQEASSADTSRIAGRSGSRGMTSVCCSETSMPQEVRIAMVAQEGTRRTDIRRAPVRGTVVGTCPREKGVNGYSPP